MAVNESRRAGWTWLGLFLAAVLFLGACGSGSSGSGSSGNGSAGASGSASGATSGSTSDSSESSTSSQPTDLNSTPSAEGSGPEQPQSQQNRPAVEVVGLPVGGGGDPNGAAQQCVGVSWISNTALPSGFAITVTDIHVTEPFVLVGDCAAKSHPSCLHFVFDATNTAQGGTQCEVGIQWDPQSKVTDDAAVSLRGELNCSAGTNQACAQLKTAVDGQAKTISVTPPPPASSSESSPSDESSSGASSSPETSGSEQSGTPDTSSPES
jgi:hypothetical protein